MFHILKEYFQTTSLLQHFNLKKLIQIEINILRRDLMKILS